MTQVTLSPKFQVVIPKEVREKLTLHKGQKITVLTKGQVIIMMPNLPIKHFRGFVKKINTEGLREKKDRL